MSKKTTTDWDSALPGAAGSLDAVLIRADGSHRDLGCLSKRPRLLGRPIQWWRALWKTLRDKGIIPISMGFAAFLSLYGVVDHPEKMLELFRDPRVHGVFFGTVGLVVTGGANFLAADFASGQASPRISSMNFHDSGTGTLAETSTDSGLSAQAGPTTRATGTQSSPATNQYRTAGTITYTGALAITEWALFNQAAQGGTMWDHRVFGAINVASGDSVQFTYTLQINAGGT
jgi:hypothetical protein